jgi:hypothetical protein
LILKGNQRAGGQQLAAHLMNAFDNERVEVADVRGAIADDLSGAFEEWEAQSRGTKCKKYIYSFSASPDQSQGRLTREQYLELLDRTERSLKLVGQPRAVVFHEKKDKDGVPREHCHAVWSRIDTEKMKAVQIAHDRLKLRTVARDFCRDHGLELPEGMKPGKSKGSRRDRFNTRATQENYAERQQQERTGIPKAERMADIATCWKETSNGAAFVHALQSKGYYLARGDSRDYVVVDLHGEIHSLSKQLKGAAKSKEMRERLSAYPPDKLPDVETARAFAKKQREEYEKQKQDKQPSEVEKRRAALGAYQQQRRDDLDQMRINLIARHISEREGLKAAQQAQTTGIVSARLQRQPKGFMAFLTRITGIKLIVEARQKQQDKARGAEHQQQTESLKRTHDRELHEMDRRYRALDRLDARENRAADTALKREEFQLLVQKKQAQRVLKPEFDRAAQPSRERTGTQDGRALSDTFDKAAKPPVDLTEAFNREVENRLRREEIDRDRDTGPDRSLDPKDRNR